MTINIDYRKNVWLSREYLINNGVMVFTIERWRERNICKYTHIDQRLFINYDTIPAPTRLKLPDKAVLICDYERERADGLQQYFFLELFDAYNGIKTGFWRNEILKLSDRFSDERLKEFSRKAAVFERILSIYNGKKGELEPLHRAYLQLFPDSFSKKNRFCMAFRQARKEGVLSVAVKHTCLNRPEEKYKEDHKYFAFQVLSHNKGFELTAAYEIFSNACEAEKIGVPTFKWFWTYFQKNRNDIERGRLGASRWEAKNGNYAKIIPALNAGDQWQIDGWRIPFYGKKLNGEGKIERFVEYILFTVLDAHSRKIIGYSIAESENTEMILKGLEMAVKDTLTLPFEIVSDNHSFHKTQESGSLKDGFSKMGVTWTVDSNPRRKAILERAFRTLGDKHFKKRFGYVGQGIRTKIETGVTQPELMDVITKTVNMMTFEQIVAVTASVINEYNNSQVKILKDTPVNLYAKSERPNAIPVDDFKRMALFVLKTEHTVKHGQITIRRGGHVYEYQLSAQYTGKYNNQTVGVRYTDLEKIYLYELKTDEPICIVKPKTAIHGALANQTEKDREALQKNTGRKKGIEVQSRERREQILELAEQLGKGGAYERMNKLTTPKDALQEIRNNDFLRNQIFERFGFNVDNVPDLPVAGEMLDTALKPRKEKENRYPFHREKGTMEKMTIDINN